MIDGGESGIPKKIWAIWLNFNHQSDGVLDENLLFFSNRIKFLHPCYEVNIITEWAKLIEYVEEDNMIMKLLNNQFVEPAHKADAIRFFLLKTHGGIWIDLSTFLVESVDSLIKNKSFVCFYASTKDVEQWILKPFKNMYNELSHTERNELLINQEKYISIKDEKFDFMPENYFICSTKNHEIVVHIYEMLHEFWTNNLDRMIDESTTGTCQNLYMMKLMNQIFHLNIPALAQDFIPYNESCIYLQDIFDNGYLFNYLQMYIGIQHYCKKYTHDISYINNKTQPNSVFDKNKYCSNIEFNINNSNILLLSATFSRSLKWSDNIDNRISWEGTYLGELIKAIKTKEQAMQVLQFFSENKMYQFKFGTWTRNSKIIPILRYWYNNP